MHVNLPLTLLLFFATILFGCSSSVLSDTDVDKASTKGGDQVDSTTATDTINSKDDTGKSSKQTCPNETTGEIRSKDNQYEDYPSFDSADRPYFGRVRLPDDTLYLAGLQIEPLKTEYNLICVEVAMVVVFGLILAASNYINSRRQKCYYAKIHAAWGVVHGGGGNNNNNKTEAASVGTSAPAGATPKKKSSISAQHR